MGEVVNIGVDLDILRLKGLESEEYSLHPLGGVSLGGFYQGGNVSLEEAYDALGVNPKGTKIRLGREAYALPTTYPDVFLMQVLSPGSKNVSSVYILRVGRKIASQFQREVQHSKR